MLCCVANATQGETIIKQKDRKCPKASKRKRKVAGKEKKEDLSVPEDEPKTNVSELKRYF